MQSKTINTYNEERGLPSSGGYTGTVYVNTPGTVWCVWVGGGMFA